MKNDESPQDHELSDDFLEIFQNSFDGIFVVDADGRAVMANAGCERNYDLTAAEMIGRPVRELEAAGYFRPLVSEQVVATGRRVTTMQTTHKGKTIMATGIPLFDKAGQVRRVIINSRDMTELVRLQTELEHAQSEVAQLRQDRLKLDGIVLQSTVMQRIAALALRVARSEATVLINGESGVGKEVFARLIHNQSARAKASFIKINCGAIPRELLESELFGYDTGAFTGAQRKGKPGMIELADQGTLFLDEIGELPLDMQVKLLHVLQDRILTRVGATRPTPVDIRVVAATNRDLTRMVEEKTFRNDLFYRLNVVPIELPPLRQRRDDILPLLQECLAFFNERYRCERRFSPLVIKQLIGYDWPGNVRELRNIVERLVVTAIDDLIGLDDLPTPLAVTVPALPDELSLDARMRSYELALIEEAMHRFGTTRAAARHLGISQSAVVRKLKKGPSEDGAPP